MKCGTDIDEMNTVRKHLSKVKGGRLAEIINKRFRVLTLILSDVVEDKRNAEVAEQAVAVKDNENEPQAADVVVESQTGYAIQLLASDKKLKTSDAQFKTYRGKVKCYEGSGVLKYKYCYGEFATRAEAQRNVAAVRKIFKDAFVIHYSDGKIVK